MGFQIIQPSEQLSPYIKMYWTMENSLSPDEKHIQKIIPNGLTELTFYQKDIPDTSIKKGFLKSQTQISGQRNCHFDIIVSGQTKLFSILFKPLGISKFFHIPASELFNQTIPLQFILGEQADEIEDRIFEAKTIAHQVEIVEGLLLSLLAKNKNNNLSRISFSIDQINSISTTKLTPALATEACLSRKQFERNFLELIGISPRQFIRVVRFQRSLFLQQNNPDLKLTQLAIDAGYYDQSHMISEFKQLSGLTPKKYFEQCLPFSDYFSEV